MTDDDAAKRLEYLQAIAGEHGVKSGVLFAGLGADPQGVLVRAIREGGAIRLVVDEDVNQPGPQLMIARADLLALVEDAQPPDPAGEA